MSSVNALHKRQVAVKANIQAYHNDHANQRNMLPPKHFNSRRK